MSQSEAQSQEPTEAISEFAFLLRQAIDCIEKRSDFTTDPGQGDAAQVELGPLRRGVDINFDTNGSSEMTVEVSNDGFEWAPFDTQSLNDAQDVFQYDIPWEWVRAYADQNLDRIEISTGGFQ